MNTPAPVNVPRTSSGAPGASSAAAAAAANAQRLAQLRLQQLRNVEAQRLQAQARYYRRASLPTQPIGNIPMVGGYQSLMYDPAQYGRAPVDPSYYQYQDNYFKQQQYDARHARPVMSGMSGAETYFGTPEQRRQATGDRWEALANMWGNLVPWMDIPIDPGYPSYPSYSGYGGYGYGGYGGGGYGRSNYLQNPYRRNTPQWAQSLATWVI